MHKRFLSYWLAICLAWCTACYPRYAYAEDNKEYLVKAAFIYNFVKFVTWPNGKAIGNQSNIDICILGDSLISKTGEVFKAASTTKLNLSLLPEKSSFNHCHILFVSSSEETRLDDIFATLKGQPILTVSDISDFAERGGMIGFVMSENKIKVVVNTRSVAATGMRVDAQLLEIALKVIDR